MATDSFKAKEVFVPRGTPVKALPALLRKKPAQPAKRDEHGH
jgi:hypothetical protein